jgi:K+-transporting ATPase ATPase C chain
VIKIAVRAALATLVLAVLTGVLYPIVITALAQVALPGKADGSLVQVDGTVVGSSLIGQRWTGTQWFYGRPSAIDDDASTSSGSNLGPTSRVLATTIGARAQAILTLEGPYHPGLTTEAIPPDLLTASASGLDPDISVAAAEFQAPRIAAVRNVPLATIQSLIADHTQGRTLGLLGELRVNVMELDLALQRLAG